MHIFLPANRTTFYSRASIPLRLRPFFSGRKDVWRSLRTTDKELARVRAVRWQASGRQLFLTLKRYGERMNKANIEALVQRWLDSALDEAPLEWTPHRAEDLQLHHDSLLESLIGNHHQRMTTEADELLQSAELPALDHGSQVFAQLCRRLLEAHLEYTKRQQARLNGDYPPFNSHLQQPLTTTAPPPPATPTKLFSEVVMLYYDENKPRSPRSGLQIQIELKHFLEIIGGDKPIGQITKEDCRTYKEHLMKTRQLALITVVKWLGIVSSIFRWASRQGYVPDHFKNPMDGLAPNAKRAKAESRSHRDYTDQELLTVFGSQDFLSQRASRPERYWLCLICLFSGCRREEAGQLFLKDIQEQDSIPYFNITDEGEGQQLKTEDSRRKVPIHSALIQLGFLEYVQTLRQAGEVRLFPLLKKGKNTFADAVGKFYRRLLKRVGLKDHALVLHGLRHTAITRLSDAGVPEKIKMMLVGHASQGVHSKVYDHRERVPLKLLQEGLEKLQYPEVVQALNSKGQREEAA